MVPRPGPVGARGPKHGQHPVHWLRQWGGCSHGQDQTSGSKHQAHPSLRKSQHAPFTFMLKSSLRMSGFQTCFKRCTRHFLKHNTTKRFAVTSLGMWRLLYASLGRPFSSHKFTFGFPLENVMESILLKAFPKISAQGREFQFNIISGYRYAGRPILAADICVCTCIGIGQFFSKIIFLYFFLPWFTDSSTVDIIIVSFLWYELREQKPYRLQILAQEKSVLTYRLRLMKKNLIGIVP